MNDYLVLSCEHAGNQIPLDFADLFLGKEKLLNSHRAYDRGAYFVFSHLVKHFHCFHIDNQYTRLLIDFNRSLDHPGVFSMPAEKMTQAQKVDLIENAYLDYRKKIKTAITQAIAKHHYVLHISVHSFTPILKGEKRQNDIGLLYDPKRPHEKKFAYLWKSAFLQAAPDLVVQMNQPYSGTDDGLTTTLRQIYRPMHYLGLELEMNQKHFRGSLKRQEKMAALVLSTLVQARKLFTLNQNPAK